MFIFYRDEFDIIPIENKETKFLLVDSKLAFNCQHVKELVVLLSKNFMAARKKMKTLECLKNEKTIVGMLEYFYFILFFYKYMIGITKD